MWVSLQPPMAILDLVPPCPLGQPLIDLSSQDTELSESVLVTVAIVLTCVGFDCTTGTADVLERALPFSCPKASARALSPSDDHPHATVATEGFHFHIISLVHIGSSTSLDHDHSGVFIDDVHHVSLVSGVDGTCRINRQHDMRNVVRLSLIRFNSPPPSILSVANSTPRSLDNHSQRAQRSQH